MTVLHLLEYFSKLYLLLSSIGTRGANAFVL
jgi:hypothetical protein